MKRTVRHNHGGRWGFMVAVVAAFLCIVAFSVFFNPVQSVAKSKVVLPEEVFEEVNDVRRYFGLDDLTWNEDLATCANVRARETEDYFSHTRPDGRAWYTVDPVAMEGENLLWTSLDRNEVELVSLWMQSPSHRSLILDNDFETMGIAGYTNAHGIHYWVIEFGK